MCQASFPYMRSYLGNVLPCELVLPSHDFGNADFATNALDLSIFPNHTFVKLAGL